MFQDFSVHERTGTAPGARQRRCCKGKMRILSITCFCGVHYLTHPLKYRLLPNILSAHELPSQAGLHPPEQPVDKDHMWHRQCRKPDEHYPHQRSFCGFSAK